ncbi:MAG: hypothetical protein OER88_10945 [Planctomycetota bacterium]|nr:hypothetical protein [Planctomycetota bacterium]
MARWFTLFAVALLAACGGASAKTGPTPLDNDIALNAFGAGWIGDPVQSDLDRVSNNGSGYTGEIEVYELVAPSSGHLWVSLDWDHDSDFDVILADDALGRTRFAEGLQFDGEPEYIGMPVTKDQKVYILVAGWTGEPGPYTLETILLAPDEPLFDFDSGPDLDNPWPCNKALTFTFNKELDPDQDVDARVVLVGGGRVAEGEWCIDGRELTFYPRLPVTPTDPGGLEQGAPHTLQFPRAARGVRAITGEYLEVINGATFRADGPVDFAPTRAVRVSFVSLRPGSIWDGSPVQIDLSKPIDPASFEASFYRVEADGSQIEMASVRTLEQFYTCEGELRTQVFMNLAAPPGPATMFRIVLPGTIRALGSDRTLDDGAEFRLDFATR